MTLVLLKTAAKFFKASVSDYSNKEHNDDGFKMYLLAG